MNAKELKELDKLGELWATRKATTKQIERHMELSRKLKQQKEQS